MKRALALFCLLPALMSCKVLGIRTRSAEAEKRGIEAAEKYVEYYKKNDAYELGKIQATVQDWKHIGNIRYTWDSLGSNDLDSYDAFKKALSGWDPLKINAADGQCRKESLTRMREDGYYLATDQEFAAIVKPCEPAPSKPGESAADEVCYWRGEITRNKAQLKRQEAVERESGVSDLAERRRLGENIVSAKEHVKEALANFRAATGKDFDQVYNCND